MNLDNIAIPLAAATPNPDELMVGTGFLVEISGHSYLTTAAHILTGVLAQRDHWSSWSKEINIYDGHKNLLTRISLFTEKEGAQVPAFHYGRTTDDHHRLLDLIMLPLTDRQLEEIKSDRIPLPESLATSQIGDSLLLAGCPRDSWPQSTETEHTLIGASPDHLVLHIAPEAQEGSSGGPLLTRSGKLLGINYGADNPLAPGAGLALTAAFLRELPQSNDGYLECFTYEKPTN